MRRPWLAAGRARTYALPPMSMKTRKVALALGVSIGLSLGWVGCLRADETRAPEQGQAPTTDQPAAPDQNVPWQDARLLAEVLERVEREYVEPVDDHQLLQAAIRGMVSSLDPYSAYLDGEEYDDIKISSSGEYSGVGIEVSMEDGEVVVVAPLDGSSAAAAGIRSGDVIATIDGVPVNTTTLADTIGRMRGKEGTSIKVGILREGSTEPIILTLKRSRVELHSVSSEMAAPGFGYVRIAEFSDNTGEEMTAQLRACAAQEAEIQASLRVAGETVTAAEVTAQRLRDQAGEAEVELTSVAALLGLSDAGSEQGSDGEDQHELEPLGEEEIDALQARVQRLTRRREQLGPVNPLAQEEYAEAVAHVEELEGQRSDLETALRELRSVIRETDRQIEETFEQTFAAAARNFEELVGDVFPGGSGRLRLVRDEQAPRPVLGGQRLSDGQDADAIEAAAEAESEAELRGHEEEEQLPGVEIEITPAGKSTKRLTLLSGGEKSMTALAFLFAVFLARPCPFYILDEVEAALDDLNLDRFLTLLRRYSDRAQFIVITHQKRTMEAADWLYGVSMGQDGVSKVLSRSLPAEDANTADVSEVAEVAEVA